MQKIFISILLISFVFNFVNAEEVKQTKEVKQINKKELSREDEDFLKEMEELDKKSKKVKNNLEESKKMGKILDELNNQFEKDKK